MHEHPHVVQDQGHGGVAGLVQKGVAHHEEREGRDEDQKEDEAPAPPDGQQVEEHHHCRSRQDVLVPAGHGEVAGIRDPRSHGDDMGEEAGGTGDDRGRGEALALEDEAGQGQRRPYGIEEDGRPERAELQAAHAITS